MAEIKKLASKYFALILIFFYAIVSYLYIRPFYKTGMLFAGDDMPFHLARIEDIYQGMIHGSYALNINLYAFNNIGDGVHFFYPWIAIYPFALLRLIIHDPVSSIYAGLWLLTFITFFIAYHSMHQFSHSRLQSVVFSLIYTLSMFRALDVFKRFDLGESIAIAFLPLVFLGIYFILFGNDKKWYYLVAGMSGIIYAHILSFLIVVLFLAMLTIAAWKNVKDKKTTAKYLALSASLTFLTTSIFWGPFLEQYFGTPINKPMTYDLLTGALKLNDVIDASFANTIFPYNLGIFLGLTLLVGWMFFKEVPRVYRMIYLLGIMTLIVTSTFFPWKSFQNTPLSIIQFPWRLLTLVNLFLSAYGSKLLTLFVYKSKNTSRNGILILLALSLPVLFCYSSVQSLVKYDQGKPLLTFQSELGHYLYPYKVNAAHYHLQFPYSSYLDYFPAKSIAPHKTIMAHQVYINNKSIKVNPKLDKNAVIFKIDHIKPGSTIDLPFLAYKNDRITINGKNVPYHISNRGTLETAAVAINNTIIIKYRPSFIDHVSFWTTVITYLTLLLIGLKNIRRKPTE